MGASVGVLCQLLAECRPHSPSVQNKCDRRGRKRIGVMYYIERHPIGVYRDQQIVFVGIPTRLFSVDISNNNHTGMEPFSTWLELIILFLELKNGPRLKPQCEKASHLLGWLN